MEMSATTSYKSGTPDATRVSSSWETPFFFQTTFFHPPKNSRMKQTFPYSPTPIGANIIMTIISLPSVPFITREDLASGLIKGMRVSFLPPISLFLAHRPRGLFIKSWLGGGGGLISSLCSVVRRSSFHQIEGGREGGKKKVR